MLGREFAQRIKALMDYSIDERADGDQPRPAAGVITAGQHELRVSESSPLRLDPLRMVVGEVGDRGRIADTFALR